MKSYIQFSFHVVHSFLLYVVQVSEVFLRDAFLIQVVLDILVLDVYVLVPER
jgi:hypothetical protein